MRSHSETEARQQARARRPNEPRQMPTPSAYEILSLASALALEAARPGAGRTRGESLAKTLLVAARARAVVDVREPSPGCSGSPG